MSKFHAYSARNVILIFQQRPDATHIAGFNTWKSEFGRNVNRGEKGIKIIAPYSIKKGVLTEKYDSVGQVIVNSFTGIPEKEYKEIVMQSFRIVFVFDILQTNGKPLPELVEELKSHFSGAEEIEKAIRQIADCPIEFEVITNGAKGYYNPTEHRIAINKNMMSGQKLKTMIHEICHSRLDCKAKSVANKGKDRADEEIIAESVAFIVLEYLGFNTGSYSFPYIASWAGNQDLQKLSSALSEIQKEADALITLLSKELS
ncbi:MAG: ArdC family protein [Saccharofermentanales bacterium]